jgi:hypothetical protein
MTGNVGYGMKSYHPILNWLLVYQRGWLPAELVERVTDLTLIIAL